MNLLARHPSQTTSGRLWTPCTSRSGWNPPQPMPWKGNCTRPCYFGSIRGCCRGSGHWSATFGVYHEPWAASLGPESGGGAEAPSDPPPPKEAAEEVENPSEDAGESAPEPEGAQDGGPTHPRWRCSRSIFDRLRWGPAGCTWPWCMSGRRPDSLLAAPLPYFTWTAPGLPFGWRTKRAGRISGLRGVAPSLKGKGGGSVVLVYRTHLYRDWIDHSSYRPNVVSTL